MKHRFRFSKESKERVNDFGRELPQAPVPAPAQEEKPEETAAEAPMETAIRTDVGLLRASNQDAPISGEGFLGVADGMGGHNGGETASACAKEKLEELLKDREPDPMALANAVRAANRYIYLKAQEEPSLSGMGTTLTLLWAGAENMYIAHVGDSRCYLLRDGALTQVTDDHSLVMEMVRAGMLTREQAAVHSMRNVITRAVGTDAVMEPDILVKKREKGDLWLICSDGLHGMVKDEEMQAILTEHPLQEAADLLIQAALDGGGKDNVTLALLLDREGSHE